MGAEPYATGDLDPSPVEPPDGLKWRQSLAPTVHLRRLVASREIVRALVERELRARYKQTALGVGWALLTPALLLGAFVGLFHRVAGINTGSIPYPVFAAVGVVAWTFFSSAVANGATSLLSNASVLNRVACPREVFPLASVAVAAIDAVVAAACAAILLAVFGAAPMATAWLVIPLALVQVAFTCAVTLMLSAFVVYARDVRYLVPLVLQFGLFVTPIGFPLSRIPGSWRWAYAAVYPLGPTIDGYRRVLFGQGAGTELLLVAAASAVLMLCAGYAVFKRLESGIADVV